MLALWKEVCHRRELLWILVQRNIKIRYKNSALGFFWSLLSPLFLIVIYAIFLRILQARLGNGGVELPTLVTGIICWQFLVMCLGDSLHAIVGNANLVTKTAFPRIVLPLSMVLANLVNFLFSLVVLVIFLLVMPGVTFGAVTPLPFILLTHVALCLGLALIICCLNVYFRDTEHVLGVVTLAWFFLTPVIYPYALMCSAIPARFEWVLALNPMVGIMAAYRGVFLGAGEMGPGLLAVSFGLSWLVLLVGVMVFQRVQRDFADEL